VNRLRKILFTLTLALIVAQSGHAEAPTLMSYQGRLELSGAPVPNSQYDITFSIYDAPTGGAAKWSEPHTGVLVMDGLFNVVLGSLVPLVDSVFRGTERYLEISVGGETILPRTRLTSSGYALRVATIDNTTGGNIIGGLSITPSGPSFFTAGEPTNQSVAEVGRILIGFSGTGSPILGIYEPVDSRARSGATGLTRSIEIRDGSMTFFGETEQDTTFVVSPGGDITGIGQITMGQNSTDGNNTTVFGFENAGDGDSSTISGGSGNAASGTISVVGGGYSNSATAEGATIGGGAHNSADGLYSTISGGFENGADGAYATVPGGNNNEANGDHSLAAGYRAKALHNGSFVWADQLDEDFSTTGEDQFIVRARGGVGIGTDNPTGLLDVVGEGGDGSVNLPDDAIASPEILDEPGLASNVVSSTVTLTQRSTATQALTSVTIVLPAAGYVLVRGEAYLEIYGTSQRNQAYVQVGSEPSTGALGPQSRLIGNGDNDASSRRHYMYVGSEQIFYKEAGNYTFAFEGLAHPMNGSNAITNIQAPRITALYIPSSYGSVASFVGRGSADFVLMGEHVNWPSATDSITTVKIDDFYKVDLRELELKVLRTRLDAEQAERELLRAQMENK